MTLLKKLFIVLFAVIIVPTIVLMTVNYNQTKTFIEDESKLSNHQIVKQAKVATDSIISQTERISNQIAVASTTQQFMYDELDTSDYGDYKILDDIYDIMLNFKASTQYIDEIAVYKMSSDLLISTNETQQPAISIKTEEYMYKLSNETPMKMWIEPNSTGVYWEQSGEFQFVRFLYQNMDELVGFVVISLKNNDFDRLINEMYIKDDGMLFIADQTGKLILSSKSEYRNIIDLSLDYNWFNHDENYKEVILDKQKYFLSLVTSDYNNWKYISITDKAEVEAKLNIIRMNTIILLVLFLFVSILLSFAVSKGIYNPIEFIKTSLEGGEKKKLRNNFLLGKNEFLTINNEITTLLDELRAKKLMEDDYEDSLKKLHKYHFYRLIKGESVDENDLVYASEDTNDVNKYHVIIIEFIKKPEASIDDLMKKELDKIKPIEYFYESDTRLVVLRNTDGDHTMSLELEECLKAVGSYSIGDFDANTVMVVGKEVSFNQIRSSYEHLLKVLKYCLITNTKGIVEENQFALASDHKRLPYDYQTYLNNSLRSTSIEESKTIILELEKVVKSDFYYASNYSFYYKDVLNTIIGFLYEIQYIKSEDMQEVTESFSDFDERFTSIDDATEWTLKFITNIFTFIDNASNESESNLIARCIKIIESEFINDISLGEVADRLDISIPYLSKQFKEETGINFKDYVTGCKIEKSQAVTTWII